MSETIKSFLVGLGFGVDEASLSKFNKAIASATVKVTALYAATNVMAAAIVKGISSVSESFEEMGYEYRIIAPAINKALVLRNELLKAYSAAGINIQKVIVASVKLNMSLAKTKFAMQAIYQSVASRFFGLLTKQSDTFRQKLYQNMPRIQNALERFVKFIFKAVEAVTTLATRLWSILTRVYDFFVSLDKATDGWSTIIIGVIAAWKLLNLEFLATPLGMIIAGLVAILALFDDFKTWQSGGKSLFDWAPFLPVINAMGSALSAVKDVYSDLLNIVGNLVLAMYQLFKGDYSGAWQSMKDGAQAVLQVFINLWDTIKGLGGALGALGSWAGTVFGNSNAGANIQNNPVGQKLANPVGSGAQNALTNQNVHQQTSINVMGSPDANATANAVAGNQGRVNSDLTRNLKGATR